MNEERSEWQTKLMLRFSDRENIDKEEVFLRYFSRTGLPKGCVLSCLNFIEFEYDIPAGLLRPDDSLTKLFEPIKTKNPWRWLEYQVRAGDRQAELQYQLTKRMRSFGTNKTQQRIDTIGDLIHAWCGAEPISHNRTVEKEGDD